MKNQFSLLSLVRTLAIATVLSMIISPRVLASNFNSPDSDSKTTLLSRGTMSQRKTAKPQQRAKGTCDPRMKKIKGVCRTTANVLVLSSPIVVNIGDPPYDCAGSYLVPPILNGSTDPENEANRYLAPSSPQVAFYVPKAENVQIRNCKIVGFDFGIFATDDKPNAGTFTNIFDNNQIIAHYAGISLMR